MIPRGSRLAGAAATATIILTPAAATACRIDHDTPSKRSGSQLSFWFDCGIACGNYFPWVDPGKSVSRPGKAGKVQAGTAAADVCETGTRIPVGAHGEVAATYNGPKADPAYGGFIPGSETFTWVSNGGNSWTSPIINKAREREAEDGGLALCWSGTP